MYIKYQNTKYPCSCAANGRCVKYIGLPADFPVPVSGKITLYANDGFLMREDVVEDYLRQIWESGVLELTNAPEPTPEPVPEEPEETETVDDVLNALLGVI